MEVSGDKWYEVEEMVDSMLPVSTKAYGDCMKSINYLQQVKAWFCYYDYISSKMAKGLFKRTCQLPRVYYC